MQSRPDIVNAQLVNWSIDCMDGIGCCCGWFGQWLHAIKRSKSINAMESLIMVKVWTNGTILTSIVQWGSGEVRRDRKRRGGVGYGRGGEVGGREGGSWGVDVRVIMGCRSQGHHGV